jgi:2'-5' RNA ligase
LKRFTLCIFVEEKLGEEFEFDSRQWPLHITIIGNYFGTDAEQLVSSIDAVIAGVSTFKVIVGQEDYLGPNSDILVNRIQLSEKLEQIHVSLVDALEKEGVEFSNSDFLRAGYKPHITVHEKSRKSNGDNIIVSCISLVQLEKDGRPHQRTVIKNFILQDGEL